MYMKNKNEFIIFRYNIILKSPFIIFNYKLMYSVHETDMPIG